MNVRWQRVLSAARWLFGPAALCFIIFAGLLSYGTLESIFETSKPWRIAGAIAIWCLLHLLTPVIAWTVLRGSVDARIRYATALRVHLQRLPSRYLPGGIWHTVSRAMDFHALGASRPILASMVAVETIIPLGVALVLGGLFVIGGDPSLSGVAPISLGLVILVAGPALLKDGRLNGLLESAWLDWRSFALLLAVSTVFWICAATAFACYWSAFSPAHASLLPEVYGAYLIAWAAGFIAVFSPQGVGVFEAVIGVLIPGGLAFASIVLLAAGFRACVLAADILAFLSLWVVRLARSATS